MPNVPQYWSFFVHVKGEMPHMMVDKKLTIEFLNKLLRSIEIGKIFFCIIIENCDYVDIQTKKNSLLKILDSKRNLATTHNHTFNESAGSMCNEVESYMLSQF